MADFELTCKDLGIELYVLPPKKPKYNDGVERGNRIFREEFYAKPALLSDSIGNMKYSLKQAVHKYNSFRPHKAIDYITPFQYLTNYLRALFKAICYELLHHKKLVVRNPF